MNDDANDFAEFMKRREEAARTYVRGEAEPLAHLVAGDDPATFFGPNGGHEEGAERVASVYRSDATAFAPKGKTHFEVLHQSASGDLGYWTGFQHATVRFGDQTEPVDMTLRITEVFRRENGTWKIVHRHADSLASPKK